MFSQAAIATATNVIYDFKLRTLKDGGFNDYAVISLNKKHALPSPEMFKNLTSAVFVTSFPLSQNVVETIILASMFKSKSIAIAIKNIDNEVNAKTALFAANQIEIPIIFLPPKSENFLQIIEELTKIWILDPRIKMDCYPVKQHFMSHISHALGGSNTEEQSFAACYANYAFKQKTEILQEMHQKMPKIMENILPRELIQNAIKEIV